MKRRVRQRGFTLLEVLVATAILGVAVTTLVGLHARNLSLAADAAELTVAGVLAGDVLALARIDPALEEGALRGRFVARARDADGRERVYGGPGSEAFTWTREVQPTALPTLRQVRVAVMRDGDARPVAEMWAAVRVPGATLAPSGLP